MASMVKKDVQLERLIVIDMLLIKEKGTRGGICHIIHQYPTANNKCMI